MSWVRLDCGELCEDAFTDGEKMAAGILYTNAVDCNGPPDVAKLVRWNFEVSGSRKPFV